MDEKETLERIAALVAEGEEEGAQSAVREAIGAGVEPLVILNEGAARGMDVVGERYNAGEAFLPELVLAGDAMSAVIKIVFENLRADEAAQARQGVVVLGQARGDVHDIGKNVVGALLAVNGFEVHDLGTDVPVKAFAEKAREVGADIVGVSTLLTTSLPYLEDTLQYLRDSGGREKVRFIVGGGPVTPEYAHRIGADGWARTAFDAVSLCKRLMGAAPGGATLVVDSEAGGK